MNYLKELNAFREWLSINPLPTSAIALWYTLMSINNLARWQQSFNAPTTLVQQLTGLSKQGILDARNRLIKHELIDCQKGRKGQAPIYQMNSLIQANDQIKEHLFDPTLDRSTDEDLNIRKRKQNEKKTEQPIALFSKNKAKEKSTPKSPRYRKTANTLFEELRKEARL